MPVKLKAGGQNGLDLKAPIKQLGGGAVDSVNGMTGDVVLDIPTNVVQYTEQTLTDEEKKQARENIGAWEAYNGAIPVVCEYDKYFPAGTKGTQTLYVSSGKLVPPESSASAEVLDAWKYVMNSTFSLVPSEPIAAQKSVKSIGILANAGVFGQDFLATNGNTFEVSTEPNKSGIVIRVLVSNSAKKLITVTANYISTGVNYSLYYTISTDEFDSSAVFNKTLKSYTSSSSANTLGLQQQTMDADPTSDMQIATKKYVDSSVPSLDGYALKSDIPTLEGYATKLEIQAKQDKLTAGDNITIADGIISASGGSSIKSIALTTNKIAISSAGDYKAALTYLWGRGNNHPVDLSKCIVTIDGVQVSYIYIQGEYIFFYVPISSFFRYTGSNNLNQYRYFCKYAEAMSATAKYQYVTLTEYAEVLLSSDNYSQYIRGAYTEDTSNGNLYSASRAYVHIVTSDGRNACVDIIAPDNQTIGSEQNTYYYFPESENSNGYLYYDGNQFNISGDNTIDYIWYTP